MVQCGSAGHNIRSKPGLRGTPAGRLKKGDIINSPEEVGTISYYCKCTLICSIVCIIMVLDIASVSHKSNISFVL